MSCSGDRSVAASTLEVFSQVSTCIPLPDRRRQDKGNTTTSQRRRSLSPEIRGVGADPIYFFPMLINSFTRVSRGRAQLRCNVDPVGGEGLRSELRAEPDLLVPWLETWRGDWGEIDLSWRSIRDAVGSEKFA